MLKPILSTAFVTLILFSCKQEPQTLTKIEGKRIPISDTLESNKELEDFIAPFREHIDRDLDSVLAYSPQTHTKNDGELNTALGNLMAEAVFEQGNPVFKSRTGHDIDVVILNHGGIRSILSEGNVTKRTAYQLMPFENSIVVVQLKGSNLNQMVDYLSKAKRAHPVRGIQLKVDDNYQPISSTVNGKPIDANKTYYIATNDYLYNGGDHMEFFKPNDSLYVLDYKIRNALIDYFVKHDTLRPKADGRFTIVDRR